MTARKKYSSKPRAAVRAEQARALRFGYEMNPGEDSPVPCHVCGDDCGERYRIIIPILERKTVVRDVVVGGEKTTRAHVAHILPKIARRLKITVLGVRVHSRCAGPFERDEFLVSMTYRPEALVVWADRSIREPEAW